MLPTIAPDPFCQDLFYSSGLEAGQDVDADPEVAEFLGKVRRELGRYATVAWLEHSARVVAGREEDLLAPAAATSPSPAPAFEVYARLAKYAAQMQAGIITCAEFKEHRDRFLAADPVLREPRPTSLAPSLSCPSVSHSRPAAPSPVPSPSLATPPAASPGLPTLFSRLASADPGASPVAAAAPPVEWPPVRRAAATATASTSPVVHTGVVFALALMLMASPGSCAGAPSWGQASAVSRTCPHGCSQAQRLPPSTSPSPSRWYQASVGSLPPYPCSRCVNANRACERTSVRRLRRGNVTRPGATQPPSAAGPSTIAILGESDELPRVDRVAIAVYWCAELSRATAQCLSLDAHIESMRREYIAALGRDP